MTFAFALHVLVGLSPVLGFLAALVFLDSYKLVGMRTVVLVVLSGVAAAIGCYFANGWLLGRLGIEFASYSRYVGPVVEEIAKGLVIVALIRAHRVGFLVDAAWSLWRSGDRPQGRISWRIYRGSRHRARGGRRPAEARPC